MWDLVGNPEDLFSHNEAQLDSDKNNAIAYTSSTLFNLRYAETDN